MGEGDVELLRREVDKGHSELSLEQEAVHFGRSSYLDAEAQDGCYRTA